MTGHPMISRPVIARYAVSIDGRTRVVELEDVAGGVRVVVDGRERVVDARDLGGGMWSVLDGTTARSIQVDGVGSKLTVEVSHPDGEPRLCVAEVSDARAAADARDPVASPAGTLTLRAPIPGRVVKILVSRGDAVTSGQTLLVLEAMKMENELRSTRAGVVSAVEVTEGIAVEAGQHLISIG